jgi:hypothetical protein
MEKFLIFIFQKIGQAFNLIMNTEIVMGITVYTILIVIIIVYFVLKIFKK